jgi:hypothetical protein
VKIWIGGGLLDERRAPNSPGKKRLAKTHFTAAASDQNIH